MFASARFVSVRISSYQFVSSLRWVSTAKRGETMIRKRIQSPVISRLFKVGGIGIFLALATIAAFNAQSPSSASAAPSPDNGTIPPLLQGRITFIHDAPFSAQVEDTAIDVCTETDIVVPGFENLVYGQSYSALFDPGQFDWKVTRAGSNCTDVLVDIDPFNLFFATEEVLVFSGDGTLQPLKVSITTVRTGGVAFLPFVNRIADTPSAQ
jgi:hypothetical protein